MLKVHEENDGYTIDVVNGEGKDTRLRYLLESIHESMKEVREIIEYGKGKDGYHDKIKHDLGHFNELGNLTNEQYIKLGKHENANFLKRREIKNILAINDTLGTRMDGIYEYLEKNMWYVNNVCIPDNKKYNLRSKEAEDIFLDVFGCSVDDADGKFQKMEVYELKKQKNKEKIERNKSIKIIKDEKEEGIRGVEIEGRKVLNGNKFEKELRKAVGKNKRNTKKRRKR